MTATHSEPLWTRAFVLLCVVQFLGYAQHLVLQPTIPIYVFDRRVQKLVEPHMTIRKFNRKVRKGKTRFQNLRVRSLP